MVDGAPIQNELAQISGDQVRELMPQLAALLADQLEPAVDALREGSSYRMSITDAELAGALFSSTFTDYYLENLYAHYGSLIEIMVSCMPTPSEDVMQINIDLRNMRGSIWGNGMFLDFADELRVTREFSIFGGEVRATKTCVGAYTSRDKADGMESFVLESADDGDVVTLNFPSGYNTYALGITTQDGSTPKITSIKIASSEMHGRVIDIQFDSDVDADYKNLFIGAGIYRTNNSRGIAFTAETFAYHYGSLLKKDFIATAYPEHEPLGIRLAQNAFFYWMIQGEFVPQWLWESREQFAKMFTEIAFFPEDLATLYSGYFLMGKCVNEEAIEYLSYRIREAKLRFLERSLIEFINEMNAEDMQASERSAATLAYFRQRMERGADFLLQPEGWERYKAILKDYMGINGWTEFFRTLLNWMEWDDIDLPLFEEVLMMVHNADVIPARLCEGKHERESVSSVRAMMIWHGCQYGIPYLIEHLPENLLHDLMTLDTAAIIEIHNYLREIKADGLTRDDILNIVRSLSRIMMKTGQEKARESIIALEPDPQVSDQIAANTALQEPPLPPIKITWRR